MQQSLSHNTLIDQTKRAANVDFNGIVVDESNVIVGPSVAAALRDIRLLGALLVAAEATGSAAACLDTTVEYLKTRKQFGKLIGSYQALKHPTVDILTAIDSARSFIYHAASLIVMTRLMQMRKLPVAWRRPKRVRLCYMLETEPYNSTVAWDLPMSVTLNCIFAAPSGVSSSLVMCSTTASNSLCCCSTK